MNKKKLIFGLVVLVGIFLFGLNEVSAVSDCTPDACSGDYSDQGISCYWSADYWICKRTCYKAAECGSYEADWQDSRLIKQIDSDDDDIWFQSGGVGTSTSLCYKFYSRTALTSVTNWDPGGVTHFDSESVRVYTKNDLGGSATSCSGGQNLVNIDSSESILGRGTGSTYWSELKFVPYKGADCGGGDAWGIEGTIVGLLYFKRANWNIADYNYYYCDVPYVSEITIDSTIYSDIDADCYVQVSGSYSNPDEIKTQWYVNDVNVVDDSCTIGCDDHSGSTWYNTFTLSNAEYSRGDEVYCEARGYGEDGGYGNYDQSSTTTVSNNVPTWTSINLNESYAKENNAIKVTANGEADADSDTLAMYCCNGNSCTPSISNYDFCSVTGDTSPYDLYCTGQGLSGDETKTVRCRIYDGIGYSTIKSDTYIADNTAPQINIDEPQEKYYSLGLELEEGEVSVFNVSLTSENLTFEGDENITRYLDIYKYANVTSAYLNLSGIDVEGYYVSSFDTSTYGGTIKYGMTTNGSSIWLVDIYNDRIWEVTMTGVYVSNFSTLGHGDYPFVIATNNGTYLWIADQISDTIYKYYSNGTYIDSFATGYTFSDITTNGTYIWGVYDGRYIRKYYMNGTFISSFDIGFYQHRGIGTDGLNIWINNWVNEKISKYTMDLVYINNFSTAGHGSYNLALETNGTYIWIIDSTAKKIYKYDMQRSYPNNSYLEIGTPDGTYEWNHTGEFNESFSPNKTSDLSSAINSALNDGACDCTGCVLSGSKCTIPFLFHSDTAGILEYSAINISYDPITPDSISIELSYSASDTYLDSCWYKVVNETDDLIIDNTTITDCANITFFLPLGEINYTLTLYVNDSIGYESSSSVTFGIDTIYPLISYGDGTEDDGVNLSQSNIYVNVTWTETTFKNINFTLKNDTGIVNSTTYTITTYTINWTGLDDNNYTYFVNITDQANNYNATEIRGITLDTTPPTIIIDEPKTQSYDDNDTIELNFTVSDNLLEVDSCWYKVVNETDDLIIDNTTIADCANTTFGLPEGDIDYTLTLYSNDSINNINSETVDFGIRTDTPGVVLDMPLNNSYLSYSDNIYFNFTATDVDGLSVCSLFGDWEGENYNYISSFDTSAHGSNNYGITTSLGNYIWTVDWVDKEVYKYWMNGTYTGEHFDTSGHGTFNYGITTDLTYIYIVDWFDKKVYKYWMNGIYVSSFDTTGHGSNNYGITTDGARIYIVDWVDKEVYKYYLDGTYTGTSFDTSAHGSNNYGITISPGIGSEAYIWIVDYSDKEVYKYNKSGTYLGSFDTSAYGSNNYGITTDKVHIWISDIVDDEVYKYKINDLGWHKSYTWVAPVSGVQNYTILNISEGGPYVWNIWCNDTLNNGGFGFSNFTFMIDTTNPNMTINYITTTTGSQTITFNTTVADENLDSCWYSIYNSTGGIDGLNENVSFTCGVEKSAIVSAFALYNLTTYVNDSAGNENSTTKEFTVLALVIVPGGGGGGITIIVGEPGNWTMETETGTEKYQFNMIPKSSRTKRILLENLDVEEKIITFSCLGDLCEFLTLPVEPLVLPVQKEIKESIEFTISLPEDLEEKVYITNVIGTDELEKVNALTIEVNVGKFGFVTETFVKLGLSRKIFGLSIPYAIIFIFSWIFLGLTLHFVGFKKIKMGLFFTIFLSLSGSVFLLLII